MTLLGNKGIIRFNRENPENVTVTQALRAPGGFGFLVDAPGFINGDAVTVTCPATLPITGYDALTTANLFIHVTLTGQLALCATQIQAINGTDLLPIINENFGTMTIAPSSSNTWEIPAFMNKWTLNTDAEGLDITALGDKFTDAVKSLVSGNGQIDEYLMARHFRLDAVNGNIIDGLIFHHLVLMTEQGSRTQAQFWLKNSGKSLLPGDLYYECDILFVGNVLTNGADDLVTGSARFITVGPIQLRAQSDLVAPSPNMYGC